MDVVESVLPVLSVLSPKDAESVSDQKDGDKNPPKTLAARMFDLIRHFETICPDCHSHNEPARKFGRNGSNSR